MNAPTQSISVQLVDLDIGAQGSSVRRHIVKDSHIQLLSDLVRHSTQQPLKIITQFEVEKTQLYLIETSSPLSARFELTTESGASEIVSIIEQFTVDSKHYTLAKAKCSSSSLTDPCQNTVHLSPREQEITCLIAFGLSNKQIASRLNISIWTVSAHLRRIFGKLHVDTRAAVVYQCADLIQRLAPNYME